jgi:hypothetical protein
MNEPPLAGAVHSGANPNQERREREKRKPRSRTEGAVTGLLSAVEYAVMDQKRCYSGSMSRSVAK